MREFAAALMERGDPLPEGILRNFIVEFLRNPEKPNLRMAQLHTGLPADYRYSEAEYLARLEEIRSIIARKPGPSSVEHMSRNRAIWIAMEYIVKTWKFPATRNEATKDKGKRACAASIVREAIKKGAGLHLSEAAVVKVWNNMRLPGEQMLALYPDEALTVLATGSEKIPTD
jgi:hypothetical protein